MKSAVFTFILLCLLSLSAFAQDETKKTEAYKVDEIGVNRGSEAIKMAIEIIREDLKKNPKSSAIIFNYGKAKDKAIRVKEITRAIYFNDLRNSNINIIDKDNYPFPLIEFWIVPEGAEMPKPTNIAEKIDEIGKAPSGDLKNRLFINTNQLNDDKLFILNFGSKTDKLNRKKTTLNLMKILGIDNKKIEIIDGGYSKELKTEFWILKK